MPRLLLTSLLLIAFAPLAIAADDPWLHIAPGKGTLGKLAKDPLLFNETTTAVTNLKEIFQKINQGQGSIGKFVNDESFFKNAKMTLQKIDKATEELEDSGPLSILTTIVGKLF